MQGHLEALSAFACRRDLRACDPAAVLRTKWVILDSLAAIALGMQVPEMQALRQATLASAAAGPCWLPGTALRTNASDAALLNGTAGTWLELNEGSLIAKGHPGIQVVPVALALAQELDVTGEALLRAVLMGYEVSARVGRAARLRVAVHPHGTYGAIGAAVAVAVLKDLPPQAMCEVLRVASTLGLATSRRTLLEGATVRNVYTGHSGVMGLLAVRLVEAGFTGESSGVKSVFGQVLGDEFDEDSLTRDLASEWLMNTGYFKLHCTGRYVHAAIDAMEDALAGEPGHRLAANEIDRVVVKAFKLGAMLDGREIDSSFGARFSIPFALATLAVHGESSLEAFGESAVRNPDVQRLARRIEVLEDPSFTERYPELQLCEVEIGTTDGRTLRGRCEVMKGEPRNPYRGDEVERKFMKLATKAWNASVADSLREGFMGLEHIPAFGKFAEGFCL